MAMPSFFIIRKHFNRYKNIVPSRQYSKLTDNQTIAVIEKYKEKLTGIQTKIKKI